VRPLWKEAQPRLGDAANLEIASAAVASVVSMVREIPVFRRSPNTAQPAYLKRRPNRPLGAAWYAHTEWVSVAVLSAAHALEVDVFAVAHAFPLV
jgi:hypothetical protein